MLESIIKYTRRISLPIAALALFGLAGCTSFASYQPPIQPRPTAPAPVEPEPEKPLTFGEDVELEPTETPKESLEDKVAIPVIPTPTQPEPGFPWLPVSVGLGALALAGGAAGIGIAKRKKIKEFLKQNNRLETIADYLNKPAVFAEKKLHQFQKKIKDALHYRPYNIKTKNIIKYYLPDEGQKELRDLLISKIDSFKTSGAHPASVGLVSSYLKRLDYSVAEPLVENLDYLLKSEIPFSDLALAAHFISRAYQKDGLYGAHLADNLDLIETLGLPGIKTLASFEIKENSPGRAKDLSYRRRLIESISNVTKKLFLSLGQSDVLNVLNQIKKISEDSWEAAFFLYLSSPNLIESSDYNHFKNISDKVADLAEKTELFFPGTAGTVVHKMFEAISPDGQSRIERYLGLVGQAGNYLDSRLCPLLAESITSTTNQYGFDCYEHMAHLALATAHAKNYELAEKIVKDSVDLNKRLITIGNIKKKNIAEVYKATAELAQTNLQDAYELLQASPIIISEIGLDGFKKMAPGFKYVEADKK